MERNVDSKRNLRLVKSDAPESGEIGPHEYAEERYEAHRWESDQLSPVERTQAVLAYCRETSYIGQCLIYVAISRDEDLKEAVRNYLLDVCYPNCDQLSRVLEFEKIKLPMLPYDADRLDEVLDLETDVIDDQQILLLLWFETVSLLQFWNMGLIQSQRSDLRDVFLGCFEREHQWQTVFYDLAVRKGYLPPDVEVSKEPTGTGASD